MYNMNNVFRFCFFALIAVKGRVIIMDYMKISNTDLEVSRIALGTWRLASLSGLEVTNLIDCAVDAGINFFDHADIYGGGKCEELFGKSISSRPSLRDKIIIQSKCGIRQGYFDFSKEHIIEAAEGSLKRLRTERLDVLLLHRPDALAEPEEVAEAFSKLHNEGKVRYFGVSNHNSGQIELLQKYIGQKLVINQLQFSIAFCTMIKAGLNVNMENEAAVVRDGAILDYCRLKDITIQPWSPFQYGFAKGCFVGSEEFPNLNKKLSEIAQKYNQSESAVALAWILRHPAKMQPILGTTNPKRIEDVKKVCDIKLTREEWYDLYKAAGNIIP